ncbi:hypothetical protein OEZ85_012924 [Tetradesmus obliquus]|uniref:Fanconi-associated nuclease n=1 Tax=Tetradesmus obliquus TaxID=3088 RepID=A0ABY8U424_TETOB|nr:hypothetical protein OEZ85_012924 [Tetradesmus obliquus]
MLGKKVTGAKRREPRAGTPSLDQAEQKCHKTANQGGAAGAAQGHSTGQQKLSSFFTAKPRQQPPPASKKRAVTGSNQVKEPAEDTEAAAAAPASIPEQPHFTVYTRIVGRQHQEAVAEQQPPCKGEELLLLREPNNAVDPCAILVCSRTRAGGMRPHGHLPASVASHLASLLDSAQVEATAELADEAAAAAAADASSSGELPPFEGAAAAADSSSSSLARTGSGSIRWRLKLTIRLAGCTTSSAAAAAAAGPVAAVTAALEAAAAAGIQSLEPGRNNGAVLSASFEHILQQARQYDLHLLDTQEQAVLASMQALPPPAKCLLMRLLLRKRTWFALEALAYPDVPDTAAAAAQLSGSGLLCYSHEPGTDLAGLLPQLPAAVLKQLLALLLPRNHPGMAAARARSGAAAAGGQEGQTAKAAMLASIQLCCQSAAGWARLQGALSSVAGVWLAVLPAVAATFARLQHLYFLTPGQDLGMFLAVDRGVLRYPPYCVSRQRPVFASRAALLGYEEALALAGRVEAALEDGDNTAAWQLLQPALAALRAGSHKAVAWQEEQGATMPNPPPAHAGWVHASLGTVAVSLLEKQKRWGEAVELLRLLLGGNGCVVRRGDWWERLAINLEHQGLAEQALEAVESSLADAWVRWGDRLGLQRRLLRLAKPPRRWRRPAWAPQAEWEPPEVAITGRPLNCTVGLKSRFYGLDGSQVTVEALALQHYTSAEGGGWQGLHCEGGVWATLFGLLLWDVIFASVPDVLRSPFQVAPLDLGSECFYSARRDALDRQLSRIADGEAGAILSATWAAHSGQMCRGVNWQRFEQALLLDIVECVGGLGLAAVLRLMAEDHSGAAGGLPDLLLWRHSDRCAKAVEVKGPRDRLSHQQRFWLAAMADSGMAVEVLKVREPPATSRSRQ